MCPLDVQLPHAKTSVQCNTLSKNITEKNNNKKKIHPAKQSPNLSTNTTITCNKQIHFVHLKVNHLSRTMCPLQEAHACVLPYDQQGMF